MQITAFRETEKERNRDAWDQARLIAYYAAWAGARGDNTFPNSVAGLIKMPWDDAIEVRADLYSAHKRLHQLADERNKSETNN